MNHIKLFSSEISEDEMVVILNNINRNDLEAKILPSTGFAHQSETLLIIFELMRNLGYSASYDIVKSSVLYLLGFLKENKKSTKHIKIIRDDSVSMIEVENIDLSQEHINQLVEAAVISLIGRKP